MVTFIWQCVKTLVPSEPQNSWDLWMFIPLKMVLIGIDPYPYIYIFFLPIKNYTQLLTDPGAGAPRDHWPAMAVPFEILHFGVPPK